MGDLGTETLSSRYKDLLKLSNSGGGLPASGDITVQDGGGINTPIRLSRNSVGIIPASSDTGIDSLVVKTGGGTKVFTVLSNETVPRIDIDGALKLTEQSTAPTFTSGAGWLYVDSANKLQYLDENNVSHELSKTVYNYQTLQSSFYYAASTAAKYIPFGPSASEQTSITYQTSDDVEFLCPYAGRLIKIMAYHDHSGSVDAGDTTMSLYLDRSLTSGVLTVDMDFNTVTTWDFATGFTGSECNFTAGQRLAIRMDPTAATYYMNISVVLRFEIA